MQRSGGIDRPGLLRFRVGFAGGVDSHRTVCRPPGSDGIEVFQAEADRIDLAMAAGALRLFLMEHDPLACRE